MNWVGLYTIIKRENMRTLKVINQVIWPPIISSLLYIIIFGLAVGRNISIQGVSYLAFLVPGLIMMNVIMSSYEESSSSLFLSKFINYIQELLVAPLSYVEMVLGFLFGSILRSFVISTLILIVFLFFIKINVYSWYFMLLS